MERIVRICARRARVQEHCADGGVQLAWSEARSCARTVHLIDWPLFLNATALASVALRPKPRPNPRRRCVMRSGGYHHSSTQHTDVLVIFEDPSGLGRPEFRDSWRI